MMRYILAAVGLTFAALLASAEEQILYVSGEIRNAEIYRQFPGGEPERLTFNAGTDGHPALSPDGTKMAYFTTIDRVYQIAVLDFESGEREQLTFSRWPRSNFHPSWSPDGKRIAYSSEEDGDFDIYIMDADGKNVTNMTDNSRWDDSWLHWSPAGPKIVFTSNRDGGVDEVYLLDVNTRVQRRLTNSFIRATYPRWSPNGSQIAYVSAEYPESKPSTWSIWHMKADGSDLERLVTDVDRNARPKYSPDGKRIAFVSSRDSNTDIYAFNVETNEEARLTVHLGYDSYPDWSPDGERIAFVSTRDGNRDIFTMTLEREQLTNLTKSVTSEGYPTWSPDGEKIAFSRRLGDTSTKIFVIDSTGENEIKLADLPFFNLYPSWSPRGDKVAFVNYPERKNSMFRIFTVDPDGQNLQVLYEDQLEEWDSGITWSSDGTEIIFSRAGIWIVFLDTVTLEVRTVQLPVIGFKDPNWSRHGQNITFSAVTELAETFQPRDGVYIIDPEGNPLRTILTDGRSITYLGLAWSPDGNKILVGREDGIYTLDLDTEAMELFMESASNPNWQDPTLPRSVSPRNKLNTTWGDMKKLGAR